MFGLWEWTPLTVGVYIAASLVGWFFINMFEYALNGGKVGRGRWWAFECFWEHLLQNIPGGMERKLQKLREFGYAARYDESALKGLAKEMFGGCWRFWLVNICIYLVLGPIVAYFLAAMGIMFTAFVLAFEVSRSLQWAPTRW